MLNDLLNVFRRMTAARYRQQMLEDHQLELIKSRRALEFYRSQVTYHARAIATLEKES